MFEHTDPKEAQRAAKAAEKIAAVLWKEPAGNSVAEAMEHPKFWSEAAKKTTTAAAKFRSDSAAAEQAQKEKRQRLDEEAGQMREKQRAAEGYWQTQAMEGIIAAGLIGRKDWEKRLRDNYAARRKERAWDGAFLTEKNGVDGEVMFCLSHLGRKVDALPVLKDFEFGMSGLCISYTSINPHQISDEALACWVQRIRHLRMAGLKLESVPSWVLELSLDSLDVSDNSLAAKEVAKLVEAFAANGGTHISLGHLGLGNKAWKTITTENYPNIKGLCLAGNPIKKLPEEPMPNLEYLDLSGTELSLSLNNGGDIFSSLFPGLRKLRLDETPR